MARPLLLALAALVLLVAAYENPLAGTATRYSRDASVAALATYATLRSLSAAMSVLRDADVEGSVVVGSVALSPGQVLTPVTQTLERFADIMFVVALLSGLLALILSPASAMGGLLAGSALALAALIVLRGRLDRVPAVLVRLWRAVVSLGVVLAVLVPVAYSAAFWWGDGLTRDAALRAEAALSGLARTAPALPEADADAAPWRWIDTFSVDGVDALMSRAGAVLEATVDLSIAYALKLVVLPLALLATFWWVGRAVRDELP